MEVSHIHARGEMQEKQDVEQQVERARAKVRALVALEQKLADSITTKRHGLLASEIDSGKEFRNDEAGVRLTCGSFPPPHFALPVRPLLPLQQLGNACLQLRCVGAPAVDAAVVRPQFPGARGAGAVPLCV